MRAAVLTFVLVLATGFAHADKVYKWVDAQGNVLYTDQPRNGAQEIRIARPSVSAAQASQSVREQLAALAAVVEPDRSKPSAVTLSAPANEETIRNNDGNVTVAFRVQPEPRSGERIRLTLDGNVVDAEVSPPGIVLSGLDQGTHTLQAAVTDGSGRVLTRSDLVTFYLKHDSTLAPAGPGNYPQTYPPQPYPAAYPPQPYTPVYPPSGAPKPNNPSSAAPKAGH